jgi:hypothetical protein
MSGTSYPRIKSTYDRLSHLWSEVEWVMTPAYQHPSIQGLFFTPKGETVTFEGNELWVENCRGVKWEDPVTELRILVEKNPKHRLLYKWPLNQIAFHLKEPGRKQEAREVRAIKRKLHSTKK